MEGPHNLNLVCLSVASPFSVDDVVVRARVQRGPQQKMAEITQFLLHSKDPGAIKLMSGYGFYLLFLGRELVRSKWILPKCGQFKFS